MQQRPRPSDPRLTARDGFDVRARRQDLERKARSRDVTAVLGPTNTGKTHLAIDRMLARRTGVIGLPLRLLAREVYGRIVARMGEEVVALITGEEKIIPPGARYYVATVEAMPTDIDVEFVAIDEVQLAADLERGRVFTDRILRVRGLYETLLLGALTARPLLERLMPGLNVITRPRMSVLSYTGEKKITRLPPRSAVVTFSANDVYAIAELIRRQRGGAAIVMGALSPRTRNAQVELFQSGDVDFLIATDAIGMGLNLDVDHVAFASNRKFDGYQYRALNAAELGQIAGRAGRHTRDGTFGVTGRVGPLSHELVQQLETHAFPPAKVFQWRTSNLDFSSVPALRASLDTPAEEEGLTKAPPADDQRALEHAAKSPDIMDQAATPDAVARLWEVCQVPDYRKIAPANHADLLLTLYGFLMGEGVIPDDFLVRQVRYADRTDGDIDTLSNRIAHVRTWTFVANRNDWLKDPVAWRDTTRQVEDRLSDALHERLMQRFVDRRTSVLMKRLRENAMLESEVNETGDVMVEGQHVGVLHGFRFQADPSAGDPRDAKALRAAAGKALQSELEKRADKVASAPDTAFTLGSDVAIRWQGAIIAKLAASEDILKPSVILLADDTLSAAAREKVDARLNQWVSAHIVGLLKPLFDLRAADGMEAGARGLAYRIAEGLGSVERSSVSAEAKALEQTARAGLRALGVRFGAYHIFVPALLKPAPSQLIALLWALKDADLDVHGLTDVPQLSASGRTSIAVDPDVPKDLYRVVGFRVCGARAVRIDILERLADQIRPLVAWRPGPDAGDPPPGAVPRGGGFLVTVAMTSLLGCSGDDFAAVLTSLGYRVDRREADEAEREAIARTQAARRGKAKEAAPAPAAAPTPATDAPVTDAPVADAPVADDAPVSEATEPTPSDTEPAAEAALETSEPADSAAPAATEPTPSNAEPTATATPETPEPTEAAEADAPPEPPQADVVPPTQSESAPANMEPDAPVADAAAAIAPLEPTETTTAEPVATEPVATEPVASDAMATATDAPASSGMEPSGTPEASADAAPSEPAAPATDEADVASAAEDAEAAGPVIIEIWRVPRHQRPEGPRRRRPRQSDGAGQEQRGRRGPRNNTGQRSGPAPSTPAPAAAADSAGNPAAAQAAPGSAPGGPTNATPPRDARDGRNEGKGGKKGRRKGKSGNRPDGPRDGQRQQGRSHTSRPEKVADPDSPFAALAALKQQLEKGDGS